MNNLISEAHKTPSLIPQQKEFDQNFSKNVSAVSSKKNKVFEKFKSIVDSFMQFIRTYIIDKPKNFFKSRFKKKTKIIVQKDIPVVHKKIASYASPSKMKSEPDSSITQNKKSKILQNKNSQFHHVAQTKCSKSSDSCHKKSSTKQLMIDTTSYQGKEEYNKIKIPIAHIKEHIPGFHNKKEYTFDDLSLLIGVINETNYNIPYPKTDGCNVDISKLNIFVCPEGQKSVARHNHNGVHSARKLALAKYIYKLLQDKTDKTESLKKYKNFEWNLLLAVYIMRSGRVDESGTNTRDLYPKRGVEVYQAYMKQLNIDNDIVNLFSKGIEYAVVPHKNRPKMSEEELLVCGIMGLAHNLDLLRIDTQEKMKKTISGTTQVLFNYEEKDQMMSDLLKFSESLLRATGSRIKENNNRVRESYNYSLFKDMSENGTACYRKVMTVFQEHSES